MSSRGSAENFETAAMELALEISWQAAGVSTPNPAVGCVILDDAGSIIGQGVTANAGGPHAEVMALRQAGGKAQGGTAVVTLEPCNHTGKTGPCSAALIRSGIRRVVYALKDPNPQAAGGDSALRSAGVEVESGVLAAAVRRGPLAAWMHSQNRQRPFVSLKLAMTLDGKIAAQDGTSQWITNSASRADVQLWRSRCDAILIGTGTALADNPRLTLRDEQGRLLERQLLRVVAGKRVVPENFHLRDLSAETLFISEPDPRKVLETLHQRQIQQVYLEGGPTLATAFLRARLVDRVFIYLAPKFFGTGTALLGDLGISTLAEALEFEFSDVEMLRAESQTDVCLTGYPKLTQTAQSHITA